MKFVLDACVAVAAFRPREPDFASARRRVERILTARDAPTVPAIFEAEVISSLTKHDVAYENAKTYVDALIAQCAVAPIRKATGAAAGKLAAATGLRAADAIYAQLAMRFDMKLLTLDEQLLKLTPEGRAQKP